MDQIQPYQPGAIRPAVQVFSDELTSYLDKLHLPTEAVLVPVEQRTIVLGNVPFATTILTDDRRSNALYVSKFVAACAIGLFDAALSYLWDETIRNLREKAARYDLEYFFDSVVTDQDRRSKLRNETDLEKLEDWELIKGCLATGLISEMGYKHLDHIRDIRNHASAAHPNQNELSGLQVVAWLDTCIREVLAKEPAGPVIEIKKLLQNIRAEKLSPSDIPPIMEYLPILPQDLLRSLLRSVFGMYSDVKQSADVRNNIKLVAKSIWDICSDEARYEAGLKYATLEANADISRTKLAREFLILVEGLSYLPKDRLALELSTALDALMLAHTEWHNFYNEPAPARRLYQLVPTNGDIPAAVTRKYVKTVTMCRIGNGKGFCWDVQPMYEDLVHRFSDTQIAHVAALPRDQEFASRLQFTTSADEYKKVASQLETRAVRAELKDMLHLIAEFPTIKLYDIKSDSRYEQALKQVWRQPPSVRL